jgi:hypothetical protein
MNQQDLYNRLVDLYADDELPQELKDELESEAYRNPQIASDMQTLKTTLTHLRALPSEEFTPMSFDKILNKLYAGGMKDPPVQVPDSNTIYLQFNLPNSG